MTYHKFVKYGHQDYVNLFKLSVQNQNIFTALPHKQKERVAFLHNGKLATKY